MHIEGKYEIEAPLEIVWESLMDIGFLQRTLPGCQVMEQVGDGEYRAILNIGISVIRGTYEMTIKLKNINPKVSYTLVTEGSARTGFVKAETPIFLEKGGEKKTIIHWVVDAQVGGMLASVGSRMSGGVAKLMAGQFFKEVNKQLRVPG